MVFIALKHIEGGKHEFILVVNQFLQEVDIVLVFEVVPSQTIDVVDQLLLSLRHGTLRSLDVHIKLLGQACQFEAQLLLINHE
jgi:hypothetical protein